MIGSLPQDFPGGGAMKSLIVKNRLPIFAATLCAVAVAAVVFVRASSAEPAYAIPPPGIYTVEYKVDDLPVWRITAKGFAFDPSAVMAQIEATVAPESWSGKGGAASMAPSNEGNALLISQNGKNHVQVTELIHSLRAAQQQRDNPQGAPRRPQD
jgi:hypothetical protein